MSMFDQQKVTKFGRGQTIFRQGEQGGELYFIINGEVELVVRNDDTSKTGTVATVGPKNILGSMSFMEGEPRSATANCLTEVECIVINQTQRERLLNKFPSWAKVLIKDLSSTVRRLNIAKIELENRNKELQTQIDVLRKRAEPAKEDNGEDQ